MATPSMASSSRAPKKPKLCLCKYKSITCAPTVGDIVIGESAKMKNSILYSECTTKISLDM